MLPKKFSVYVCNVSFVIIVIGVMYAIVNFSSYIVEIIVDVVYWSSTHHKQPPSIPFPASCL